MKIKPTAHHMEKLTGTAGGIIPVALKMRGICTYLNQELG
jgi:hypothetical protein